MLHVSYELFVEGKSEGIQARGIEVKYVTN